MGAAILLCTLNARYSHASLGLRSLLANLGALAPQAQLVEATIHDAPAALLERLLAWEPRVIGFGVYIWNRTQTQAVVRLLRAVAPQVAIVLGGPEISHAPTDDALAGDADCVLCGEADLVLPGILARLLAGETVERRIACPKPDPAQLALPYHLYTAEDLAHRLIYVEASRGCPFTCEFCLSSLENGVRHVPLEPFLAAMDDLLRRGCRTFKFVDRTFNLSPRVSATILQFFRERLMPGLFLHFEMVPDRLPEALRALIVAFPPGVLQFEVGIQSFTPEVGRLIQRRMDVSATCANLTWLRQHTNVHVHADLIVGLPGETLETLAQSFDQLWWLEPGEIQVGILKLLPGTPLVRHRDSFAMVFNPDPPYDLLRSRDFPFPLMQRLKRLARYVDLLVSSRRMPRAIARVVACRPSPFAALLALSDWLWAETGQDHALSPGRLIVLVRQYLLAQPEAPSAEALDQELAADILDGWLGPGGTLKGLPDVLREPVERLQRQRRSQRPPAPTVTRADAVNASPPV